MIFTDCHDNLYDLYSDLLFLCGQKGLDFTLKVIGGELTSIPGISDAIEVCKKKFDLTSLSLL